MLERERMGYQPYSEPHDISPAWAPREYLDYQGIVPASAERRAFAPGQEQAFRAYPGYSPSPVPKGRAPQPPRPSAGSERMSKAETLELLSSLKRALVVSSLVAFGVLSGLVATNVVGSSTGASTPSGGDSSSQSAPAQSTDPFHGDDSGGFFNQQGGGGSGFGSGGSGQAPFTGSHTS